MRPFGSSTNIFIANYNSIVHGVSEKIGCDGKNEHTDRHTSDPTIPLFAIEVWNPKTAPTQLKRLPIIICIHKIWGFNIKNLNGRS